MNNNKNVRQKKISIWLKGLCIIISLMVLAYFGRKIMLEIRDFNFPPAWWKGYVGIGLSVFVAVMCILALRRFWMVCTEIGNDNSFSLENVANFHRMAIIGGICAAQYFLRAVIMLITDTIASGVFYRIVVLGGLFLLAGIFTVLCEALSQLIRNAYEVKHENDLTI